MTDTTRDEWLAWRRTGLGASDVAAIAGIPGSYGSPWSVWLSKVGVTEGDDNADMKFGRYAEPMVARWFEMEHGLHVVGEQTWCTSPTDPWALATPDGFVAESPNSALDAVLGGMEIKTARDSWADGVPIPYQAQCQWSMFVTGQPRWWIAAYHRTLTGDPFTVHVVERDDEDIAYLYNAARTFWHDHVLTGTAPAADGHRATAEALAAAWPDPADDHLEADDDLAALVALLGARKTEAKTLDGKITELENKVKAAIADHAGLTYGTDAKGKPRVLASWKPQDRAGFDAAAALAADPALERFRTTTTSRVLRLKTQKES